MEDERILIFHFAFYIFNFAFLRLAGAWILAARQYGEQRDGETAAAEDAEQFQLLNVAADGTGTGASIGCRTLIDNRIRSARRIAYVRHGCPSLNAVIAGDQPFVRINLSIDSLLVFDNRAAFDDRDLDLPVAELNLDFRIRRNPNASVRPQIDRRRDPFSGLNDCAVEPLRC